ncbi:hypothetical protein [Tenacibaculum amylolyticum]|uniref:hypothetical protein n=1 Tax=Tenacibaculum amylolyticum TaxID=104269 RepID=UPI003893CE3E
MANGFFILKDRSCFTTRWTGYDEIIRIAIRELYELDNGKDLADWLATIVPKEFKPNGGNQWGTGFVNPDTNEVFIGKELDLRSLTEVNQNLFWKALFIGYEKLKLEKEKYSYLTPERLKQLLERSELANNNDNPLEHSDWNVLAEEEYEKLGPGWD